VGGGRQLVGLGKTRKGSSYDQDVANWKRGGGEEMERSTKEKLKEKNRNGVFMN